MANTADINVRVTGAGPWLRVVKAAAAHVARAREKHGLESPDDCVEPTMAELWLALLALEADPAMEVR